ncbi:hypothetical protein HCN_p17 (plasmid) [Helicobacter cinaedi PAGU611]|uniref:hypothetical protein n=1 Tax=Helicobacter cinaedi TaxID=213 RepID=UPI000264EBEA|nr:hypothetical protein [Helicobacter cinaedi]BAM13256.1 hypothetical protein HCN_p17 [Helicobacter cinaedi PAGU611]
MNVIKKYLTLKKVLVFFAVAFLVLFCAANFSTAFMDWQYYKAKYINNKCSGIYIYDKDLYEEAKEYGDKIAILSNGFPIKRETLEVNTQYGRIWILGKNIFYIDDSGNKHTIYQIREYIQRYFRIYLSGDEAAGLRLNTRDFHWFQSKNHTFYIEEYNNTLKGICE